MCIRGSRYIYQQCKIDGKGMVSTYVRTDFDCFIQTNSFFDTICYDADLICLLWIYNCRTRCLAILLDVTDPPVTDDGAGAGMWYSVGCSYCEIPRLDCFDRILSSNLDVCNSGCVPDIADTGEFKKNLYAQSNGTNC